MKQLKLATFLGLGAIFATALVSCHSVPDVTNVPVPAGAPVLHGAYSGTLKEGLFFQDAVLSADGQHLYVIASTSAHTTLLDLDPMTGREVRRATVAVAEPRRLTQRSDGNLVLAGVGNSGLVNSGTLGLLRALPAAQAVSPDGETLLGPVTVNTNTYVLYRTETGQAFSRTTPTEYDNRVSDDLKWLAPVKGKTVTHLTSGQVVNVDTGHLDPCKRWNDLWPPRLLTIESVPSGFFLAYGDGTMEWRSATGELLRVQTLDLPCPTAPNTDALSDMESRVVGSRVLFYARGFRGDQSVRLFGEVSLAQAPAIVLDSPNTAPNTDSYNWFAGMFAFQDARKPLFPGYGLGLLERFTVWKSSLPAATFPVSLQAVATYRTPEKYDLRGTMQTPAGLLEFRGEGTVSQGSEGPKIVLTPQAWCGSLIAPPCPVLDWQATLTSGGQEIGQMHGDAEDVMSGPKAQQRGSVQFKWNGELRSFGFTLKAQQ